MKLLVAKQGFIRYGTAFSRVVREQQCDVKEQAMTSWYIYSSCLENDDVTRISLCYAVGLTSLDWGRDRRINIKFW